MNLLVVYSALVVVFAVMMSVPLAKSLKLNLLIVYYLALVVFAAVMMRTVWVI